MKKQNRFHVSFWGRPKHPSGLRRVLPDTSKPDSDRSLRWLSGLLRDRYDFASAAYRRQGDAGFRPEKRPPVKGRGAGAGIHTPFEYRPLEDETPPFQKACVLYDLIIKRGGSDEEILRIYDCCIHHCWFNGLGWGLANVLRLKWARF